MAFARSQGRWRRLGSKCLGRRGITGPVRTISEKVAALAGGDLTARIGDRTSDDSRNELDLLSRNVDLMADTLHSMVSRIAADSQELSAASSNLVNTSETMTRRAELAAGDIHAVANSSDEVNQTASEIARNCTTAADSVSRANGSVVECRRSVHRTGLLPTPSETLTVCDEVSSERCPIFPGHTTRMHWSFPDPSTVQGSEEEKLQEIRKIRDEIKAEVMNWISLVSEKG